MKLMHDYLRAARVSEAFGGAVGLEAVKQLAAGSTANTCPFCGGEALVALTQHYGAPAVRIECSCCHVATVRLSQTWDYLQEREISFEEAFARAVSRWNRREAAG